MKAVKVIVLVVAGLIALGVLLVVIGVYLTNRHLQSPAFKQEALNAAREELGVDVRIDELHASLFSGVALRGVTIGSPPNFPGNLVTAEAFVLRYRLLPLLRQRIEIDELLLDKPVITLARNDKGEWNYEKIGATKGSEPKPASPAPSTAAPVKTETPAQAKPETAVPLDVVLSKLAIRQGAVSMISEKNKPLVKLDGINFSSSVSLMANQLAGTGKAGIDKVSLSDSLFVDNAGALVALGSDQMKLSSLSGQVADGKISGDVVVKFGTGLEYIVNLQLRGSDVAKLLQQARTKPVLSGKLNITTALDGTGGLPTIVGTGRVEIADGKLMEIPVLNLLIMILQIDALRDLAFTECVVEYSISNNVMQTPVIRVTSPQVQITGKGTVSLADDTLNHDMRITFAKGALDRTPSEIRGLFAEQPDGSLALNFKVTGPYDSPKTDLTKRITQNLGQQLLEKGLRKLLR